MRIPRSSPTRTRFPAILIPFLLWAASSGKSHAGGLAWQEASQIELSELYRVGDEAAGDTVLFGGIGGMAVNSAGQILVADDRSMDVRVFSADGDQIGQFGRPGEGPGEFEDISSVMVGSNDSVFVYDWRRARLSSFEPETWRVSDSYRIESHDSLGDPLDVIGISEAGPIALFAPGISLSNAGQDRYAVAAQVRRDGTVMRTLARRLPHFELRIFTDRPPAGLAVRSVPFGRQSFFRYSRSGKLYSGWNETIDLLVTSLQGEVLGRVQRNHNPVPVTRAERDAIVQPDEFDSIHRFKPAYGSIAVDDRGQVWLKSMKRQDSTAEWLVLTETGDVAGQATLPESVTLAVIRLASGRAYGYTGGEGQAPMLVVYSVEM